MVCQQDCTGLQGLVALHPSLPPAYTLWLLPTGARPFASSRADGRLGDAGYVSSDSVSACPFNRSRMIRGGDFSLLGLQPSLKRAGSLLQLDSGAPSVNFREIHLEQAPHSLSFIDRSATSMMAPSPGIHVLHCAQTGVEPIHSGTCTRPHVSSYYRSLPSITPSLSGVSHEFSCTVARPIALAFVAHAGESCITAALEFVPVFPERHEPNCYTCISRARYRWVPMRIALITRPPVKGCVRATHQFCIIFSLGKQPDHHPLDITRIAD